MEGMPDLYDFREHNKERTEQMNTPYMQSYEIKPPIGDFLPPSRGKPMNTRTRKTVWKERVRRADLPRSMQKRLARRS